MSLPRVLVVDDLPENVEVLAGHLSDIYAVQFALSGDEALALAATNPPDLILLDAMMPGMDGYAVCESLKRNSRTQDIPVIFVTAKTDAESEFRGLAAGAVDFVHKPVDRGVLRARVSLHLKLKAQERELRRLNAELERWADESVRRSERRLAEIVDSAMDAIISVDERQRIVLFNAAAEKMFGLSEAEALGQPLARLIPERFRAAHAEGLRAYAEVGAGVRRMDKPGTVTGVRADGEEFPIEASISVGSVDNGNLCTAILRDVTERKRAEQVRKSYERQRSKIEEALRRHIAAQTAAAIAHELNQPLTAIVVFVEICLRLLDMGNPAPHELRNNLKKCAQLAQQAGQALREMLNLLHGGETPVEEVDVAAVIGEALAMLDTEGDPGGFRIVRDIDPTLPKVRANRLQIEKVLINLLRNALQAMREAGAEEGDIAVTASVKADDPIMALITVRDFGIGLDPQALRTIFQPFRTAKPAGLGLGLAVSRSLVEAAGGKLWAESNDGPGASFHFTLPFVQ